MTCLFSKISVKCLGKNLICLWRTSYFLPYVARSVTAINFFPVSRSLMIAPTDAFHKKRDNGSSPLQVVILP